ncbi:MULTISPECIES: GyrI-like domain-containing protein [Psychrobacter]|jgi:predicted transcriptional regulator YdeE|uniref:GyrI-like domain-containing protein n=1 Tax=Psychrobacter TaxID=497 RepID=UPI0003FBE807|nr:MULTISPECIES: GyrI-like domain-containing protein [Psychrobacter]NRD71457.1 GyrI-like domain-containing protein [Psychrobacter okhotskensis]
MTSQVKELSDAIVCKGISARTTNNAEISHDTAKLGRLWQKFYQNHMKSLSEGEDIYGVFHNYESDDLVGAFDVVASWKADSDDTTNASDVVTVSIPAGKYLVFSEKGNMPNTVMNAWEKAWEYFNNPSCEHTRTYKVDFEHYIGGNLEYGQVDLYIGIE